MEYYIIFAGIIEPSFGNQLLNAINDAVQKKSSKIIIFFSSIGGNTQEGFALATIIRNCTVPVAIHATNNIDSIANVIYLSAKERTAESYAKFYVHGANTTGTFDEKLLTEQVLAVKTETTRIAYYISENCNLSLSEVQKMMQAGTSITAQEALKHGIVQGIKHLEIPQQGILRQDIVFIN
jgi:ATP-dependent protease ClpP protease subunit